MPEYEVSDPQTGKTVTLTGDSAPTEQELNDVFSHPAVANAGNDSSGLMGSINNALGGKLNPNPAVTDTEGFTGNPVFEAIGKAGSAVNAGIQNAAGFLADKAGKYLPAPLAFAADAALTIPTTLSQTLIPQNAEAAGIGALYGGINKQKLAAMAPEESAMMNSGVAPEVAEARLSSAVKQPNALQKTGGALVTAITAIPHRYTSAVMADPSILTSGETTQAVGKDYQSIFEKLGLKFDSELIKKVTGKRYIPNESQASQSYNAIDELLTKSENMKPGEMDPAQAFLGRSMAASLKRSNQYLTNPSFKSVVDEAQNTFDTHLEQSGFPEVKALGQRYFKAITREHFESFLPQNKNMSPNALRSLIMGKLGIESVVELAQGNYAAAGGKAIQAAAMSPMLVGGAIRTATNIGNISEAGITGASILASVKANGNSISTPKYAEAYKKPPTGSLNAESFAKQSRDFSSERTPGTGHHPEDIGLYRPGEAPDQGNVTVNGKSLYDYYKSAGRKK